MPEPAVQLDSSEAFFCPKTMAWELAGLRGDTSCCSMPVLHINQMSLDSLYATLARQVKASLALAGEAGTAAGILESCSDLLVGLSSLELPFDKNLEIARLIAKINEFMDEST